MSENANKLTGEASGVQQYEERAQSYEQWLRGVESVITRDVATGKILSAVEVQSAKRFTATTQEGGAA